MAHVETSMVGSIGTIQLNRPEKLNALTYEMYASVADAVKRLDADPSCRVIVLRGAGRAFSSGFDLTIEAAESWSAEERRRIVITALEPRWAIWNSSTPVVAAVHGYCLAGGFELALPADFTIASEDAVFGEPESQFGEVPSFFQVPWFMGHKAAKDLLILGEHISAQRAYELGLVSRLAPADKFDERVQEYVDAIARIVPRTASALKRGVNRSYEIAGMKTALEWWTDQSAILHDIDDDQAASFLETVRSGKVAEAIKARNDFHSAPSATKP